MPWDTDDGLLSSYQGTIALSHFGVDSRYMNGEQYLWKITLTDMTDEDGSPLINGEGQPMETNEIFSLGKGWEPTDSTGQHIEHNSGNTKKNINNNTWYGKVIKRVPSLGDDLLKELENRAPLDEKDAAVWEGLRFQWERESVDYTDGGKRELAEGMAKSGQHIMPTAYLGVGEKAAPKATKPAPPSADELRTKLQALAKEHSTHDAFLDAALDVDGVADNKALVKEIGQVEFYEEANA